MQLKRYRIFRKEQRVAIFFLRLGALVVLGGVLLGLLSDVIESTRWCVGLFLVIMIPVVRIIGPRVFDYEYEYAEEYA
jgi:hypothetical protein